MGAGLRGRRLDLNVGGIYIDGEVKRLCHIANKRSTTIARKALQCRDSRVKRAREVSGVKHYLWHLKRMFFFFH